MLEKHSIWSVFCSKTTALYSKLGDRMKKRSLAFTLTEMLLALVVVAILAVLILPVVTTRAQNKSFALAYESQVKQLLNSLTGLHVMENVTDIKDTMMYVDAPVNDYTNSSGAYIKKYMKVSKYCGNSPGDCFAQKYFQYRDKDREEFTVADEGGADKPFAQATKGACALLKNGVSICLKPQVKNAEGGTLAISGWLDLNGPKGPNVYGRDLRTFNIDLNDRVAYSEEDPLEVIMPDEAEGCVGSDCVTPNACLSDPTSEECCKKKVPVGPGDPCCNWHANPSAVHHKICFPDDEEKKEECANHSITGPDDACCASVQDPKCCAPDNYSEYCCSTANAGSEQCCKNGIASGKIVLTTDSKCCQYESIYLANQELCIPPCKLDEKNNRPELGDNWRKGRSNQYCCDYYSRRKEIIQVGPTDGCCMFEDVYKDKFNVVSSDRCCRLQKFPGTNPDKLNELCCSWRFNERDLDGVSWLRTHDYKTKPNEDVGADTQAVVNNDTNKYDTCCPYALSKLATMNADGTWTESTGNGIWSQNGMADKVWKNCCSKANAANGNWTYKGTNLSAECCHFMVKQNCRADDPQTCRKALMEIDDRTGRVGELRAACCGFDEFKDYPECCSMGIDGLNIFRKPAEQWREVCCMPHLEFYNEDQTTAPGPSVQCCLQAGQSVQNENHLWFWNRNAKFKKAGNNRLDGCCGQGTQVFEGKEMRKYDKWLVNCCHLRSPKKGSDKYADVTDFVRGCCTGANENPASTEAWADEDSDQNEDCCLSYGSAEDNNTGHSRDDKRWYSRCCGSKYGSLNGDYKVKLKLDQYKFYIKDAGCCTNVRWVENGSDSCCQFAVDVKTGLDLRTQNDRYWYSNCCEYPDRYEGASLDGKTGFKVYQSNCCTFDKTTANDGKRLKEFGKIRTDDKNKQQTLKSDENNKYCCDPTISDNGETAQAPSEWCCERFVEKDEMVNDFDNKKLSEQYRGRCCRHYEGMRWKIHELTCSELWICQVRGKNSEDEMNNPGYGLPLCCEALGPKYNTEDIWRGACCDYPKSYKTNVDYRQICCHQDPKVDYTRVNVAHGSQVGLNSNKEFCCKPELTKDATGVFPSTNCCTYFKGRGNYARDNDNKPLSEAYKIDCCYQSDNAVGSSTDYCSDCSIRWKAGEKYNVAGDAYSSGAWQHYDFKGCCTKVYNETSKDGTIRNKTPLWQDNCCNYVTGTTDMNRSIADINKYYGSHAEYRAHCCMGGDTPQPSGCAAITSPATAQNCKCWIDKGMWNGLSDSTKAACCALGHGLNCPVVCSTPDTSRVSETCCSEWSGQLTSYPTVKDQCCAITSFKNNHSSLCTSSTCPSTPIGANASNVCCKEWKDAGKISLTQNKDAWLACCANPDQAFFNSNKEACCAYTADFNWELKAYIDNSSSAIKFDLVSSGYGETGKQLKVTDINYVCFSNGGQHITGTAGSITTAVGVKGGSSASVSSCIGPQITHAKVTYDGIELSPSVYFKGFFKRGYFSDKCNAQSQGTSDFPVEEPQVETCPSTPTVDKATETCCTKWKSSLSNSAYSSVKDKCCTISSFKSSNSTLCDTCPSTPTVDKATETCCTKWKSSLSNSAYSSVKDKCCTYTNFKSSNSTLCSGGGCPSTPTTSSATETCCTEWKNNSKFANGANSSVLTKCCQGDSFGKANKTLCCTYPTDINWNLTVSNVQNPLSASTVSFTYSGNVQSGVTVRAKDIKVHYDCYGNAGSQSAGGMNGLTLSFDTITGKGSKTVANPHSASNYNNCTAKFVSAKITLDSGSGETAIYTFGRAENNGESSLSGEYKTGGPTYCSNSLPVNDVNNVYACAANPSTPISETCCTEWKNNNKFANGANSSVLTKCCEITNFKNNNSTLCPCTKSDITLSVIKDNALGFTVEASKAVEEDVKVYIQTQSTYYGGRMNGLSMNESGTVSIKKGSKKATSGVGCTENLNAYSEDDGDLICDGVSDYSIESPTTSCPAYKIENNSSGSSRPKIATCTATITWNIQTDSTVGYGNNNVWFIADKVTASNIYCTDGGTMTDEELDQFLPVIDQLTGRYAHHEYYGSVTSTVNVPVYSAEMTNNGKMSYADSLHIVKDGGGYGISSNSYNGEYWSVDGLECLISVYGGGKTTACSGSQTFAMQVTRTSKSSLAQRVIAFVKHTFNSLISRVNELAHAIVEKIADIRVAHRQKAAERFAQSSGDNFANVNVPAAKKLTAGKYSQSNVAHAAGDFVDGMNKAGVTTSDWHCCVPNYETPTKACCEAFKKHDWKDFETEASDLSHEYKLYCCNTHGVCPEPKNCTLDDVANNTITYDHCKVLAESNSAANWTKSQNCCACLANYTPPGNSSAMKYTTDWKKTCCSRAMNQNDDQTLQLTAITSKQEYRDLCCVVAGTGSDGSIHSNRTTDKDERCCSYNVSTSESNANDFCCGKKAAGLNTQGSGPVVWELLKDGKEVSDFRAKCCMKVNDKYCTCSGLYDKYPKSKDLNSHLGGNAVNCCADLNSYGGKSGTTLWKEACCPVAQNNTSTIIGSDANFRSLCCDSSKYSCINHYDKTCSTDVNSTMSYGKDWRCCSTTAGAMLSGSNQKKGSGNWFCCSDLSATTTRNITHNEIARTSNCCRSEGIRFGGGSDPSCCTFSSSNEITQQCCEWRRDAVNAPDEWIPWQGTLSGFRQSCCTKFASNDANNGFCTCEYNYSSNRGQLTTNCCDALFSAHNSETVWKDNCCNKTRNSVSRTGLHIFGKTEKSSWQNACCNHKDNRNNESEGCCTWRESKGIFDRGVNKFSDGTTFDGCCSNNGWNKDSTTYKQRCCHKNNTIQSCCEYMYSVNPKDSSVFYAEGNCCNWSSLKNKDECLSVCDHFELGHDYYYKEGVGKVYLTNAEKVKCCQDSINKAGDKGWQDRCCLLADGNNFAVSHKNCCDYRTRGKLSGLTVYHYTRSSYDNGSCSWTDSNCSPYNYGDWYCGHDQCSYGESADYNEYCCGTGKLNANTLKTQYKAAKDGCCENSPTFRSKNSTLCKCGHGTAKDTNSADCCDFWWSSLGSSDKSSCCTSFSDIRSDKPSTCCGSTPTSSKAYSECCDYWDNNNRYTAAAGVGCCDYTSFYNSNKCLCDCGSSYSSSLVSEHCCKDCWKTKTGSCAQYYCSKTYKWNIERSVSRAFYSNTPGASYKTNEESSGSCNESTSISYSITDTFSGSGSKCTNSPCSYTTSGGYDSCTLGASSSDCSAYVGSGTPTHCVVTICRGSKCTDIHQCKSTYTVSDSMP